MAVVGMAVWQAPRFFEGDPTTTPVQPDPAPLEIKPAPDPPSEARPRPRPQPRPDPEAEARAAAAKRLQLPPTGGTNGVQRIALREISPVRLIELTGGEYTIGSPSSEMFHATDELQHRVRVEPFLLAESEVTQRQWQTVMGLFGRETSVGPDHPIQSVTWHRGLEFLNRLSTREGKTPCYQIDANDSKWILGCDGFRLPTEVEFEYALRAGTTTAYPFGDDITDLGRYAWYAGNAGDQPRPVRQLSPNAWGFYDMNGNVWEWVWDRYAPYPASIPLHYAGPDYGPHRVLRGGSFHDAARPLRAANRAADTPTRIARYRGLRIAMDLR